MLTLFLHLSKNFKAVEHEKGSFYPGVWIKGGYNHWFLPDIKERFPPCFDVSVGEDWSGLWRFPSQPFHLDVLETNDCFIAIFGKCGFYITARQTPTGQQNQGAIFPDKRQFRCSANASQPFSQSVSQSVNHFGKKCQGPRVEMPVHITSYDVWCFDMQNINQVLTVRDGSK